jgi:UDP-glucose 4-epimerase
MRTTVLRLANVFGPRSNIRNSDFGFINYFIGLALQGKELTVFGKGEQLRNISYVADCTSALILASQSELSNGQVFFAAADRQYNVAEIARAITSVIGGTVRYIDWPKDREVIEIGDAVISNKKIKSVLNWMPRYELNCGLIRTREYFANRLNEYLG